MANRKVAADEVVPAKPVPMKSKAKKSKATDAAPEAPVVSWADKYRPGTIGRMIAEAIVAGALTNEQILEAVKKERKDAKTTYGCIAWYRSAARKAGVIK